jgi:hypothetical protein
VVAKTRGARTSTPFLREQTFVRAQYIGIPAAAAEIGYGVQAVYAWRQENPELWMEVCEREAPRVEKTITQTSLETARMVGENEIRIQQRIADEIESLDPKDLAMLAASAQRQATAKGINVTKVLELTGRPTHIIADQTGAELLRQLRDRVPGLVVESTAVEEPVKQIESPD